MSVRSSVAPGFEAIIRLVSERAGLVFPTSRRDDAEARVRRAMSEADLGDPGHFLALLERSAAAFDALVAELTVGETYFFRDERQFAFILGEAIPDLLARRGPAHVLRVWSAACSTGEEAYSLAIALDEAGLLGRSHVVGSDISRPSLSRAAEATYGPWSLRGVDEGLVGRYFRPVAGRHALDERIRKAVTFRHLNLAQDVYPSKVSGVWDMDLILCRNVLIYFDRITIEKVAQRLFQSLAPGGWLITGPSDPLLSELADFETLVTREGVFYRRAAAGQRAFRAERSPRWEAQEVAQFSEAPSATAVEAEAEVEVEVLETGTAPVLAPVTDALTLAKDALAAGEYDAVLESVRADVSAAAAELAIKAVANRDGATIAVDFAGQAARTHSLSPELHFLHAVLLLDVERLDDSIAALGRVLYLDRSLSMAHFLLGTILSRRGEIAAAVRAYGTAAELAEACPPEEPVRLGDGELAGRLAVEARMQEKLLREADRRRAR